MEPKTISIHDLQYSDLVDRIIPRVVNAKSNLEMFSYRPHIFIKDLAVVYNAELFSDENIKVSMPINNDLMSEWKITVDELHKNAIEAATKINKYYLSRVEDELFGEPENLFEGGIYLNDGMFLVASNVEKRHGACIIADTDMLDKIADTIKDDYYIIPSSIHELLIISKENLRNRNMTPKDLGEMVREVNYSMVEPEDRLSNNVYEYNRNSKEITIVNSARDKQKER